MGRDCGGVQDVVFVDIFVWIKIGDFVCGVVCGDY